MLSIISSKKSTKPVKRSNIITYQPRSTESWNMFDISCYRTFKNVYKGYPSSYNVEILNSFNFE